CWSTKETVSSTGAPTTRTTTKPDCSARYIRLAAVLVGRNIATAKRKFFRQTESTGSPCRSASSVESRPTLTASWTRLATRSAQATAVKLFEPTKAYESVAARADAAAPAAKDIMPSEKKLLDRRRVVLRELTKHSSPARKTAGSTP